MKFEEKGSFTTTLKTTLHVDGGDLSVREFEDLYAFTDLFYEVMDGQVGINWENSVDFDAQVHGAEIAISQMGWNRSEGLVLVETLRAYERLIEDGAIDVENSDYEVGIQTIEVGADTVAYVHSCPGDDACTAANQAALEALEAALPEPIRRHVEIYA